MKTLLVLALLIGGGWYEFKQQKPGTEPEAKSGMRQVAPLLGAIEQYHSIHNGYPADLLTLVPDYLPGMPPQVHGHPVQYERAGEFFNLTFSYTQPLPVHCTYNSGTHWKCGWL